MSVKAIIPVKVWGSKGLPGKFTMNLAGKEMWQWVTEAAIDCRYIDEVYMSGNSVEKKEFYPQVKRMYPQVKWITRPKRLQENGVELLEVMKHALDKIGKKDDVFVQLQATKPMTTAKLLNEIIKFFLYSGCILFPNNSLFTVQKINTAVNWEYKSHKQDGNDNFKSCSVTKIWDYETLKNAIVGTWGFGKSHYDYEIGARHIEVDTYEEFLMAEAMKRAGL